MRNVAAVLLLCLSVLSGCSSHTFIPVEDGPRGYLPTQTLGLRAAVDTGALSPTERYSWMEVCDKVTTPSFILFTSTDYKNCDIAAHHQNAAQKTSTSGYVAGIVGPVISSGMTAAGIAYAGHAVGRGLGRSGDTVSTTNNNATTGGTSSVTGGNGGTASVTGGNGGAGGSTGGVNVNTGSANGQGDIHVGH